MVRTASFASAPGYPFAVFHSSTAVTNRAIDILLCSPYKFACLCACVYLQLVAWCFRGIRTPTLSQGLCIAHGRFTSSLAISLEDPPRWWF